MKIKLWKEVPAPEEIIKKDEQIKLTKTTIWHWNRGTGIAKYSLNCEK